MRWARAIKDFSKPPHNNHSEQGKGDSPVRPSPDDPAIERLGGVVIGQGAEQCSCGYSYSWLPVELMRDPSYCAKRYIFLPTCVRKPRVTPPDTKSD